MVVDTSLKAYDELIAEGKLATQKNNILKVLDFSNPLSLREICAKTNYDINAVSGRVNDLKKDGLVKTQGKKICPITGRTVRPVVKIKFMATTLF